jgi:hypothetical protein
MSDLIELTADVRQKILSSIRAGGYAHIAAQAWGVSQRLWRRWLALGRRRAAVEPYGSFYREVQEAKAQARLKAELEALNKDPRFWLKNGPGKDPGAGPGWTAASRTARAAASAGPPISLMQLKKFMDDMRAASTPEFAATIDKVSAVHFKLPRTPESATDLGRQTRP